jgi:hypothetical protein
MKRKKEDRYFTLMFGIYEQSFKKDNLAMRGLIKIISFIQHNIVKII